MKILPSILICLMTALLYPPAAESAEKNAESWAEILPWEAGIDEISALLPPESRREIYGPGDRAAYENRILRFIYEVDKSLMNKTKIMRISSAPKAEVIFINGKYYIYVIDYGKMRQSDFEKTLRGLTVKYGKPAAMDESGRTTYSFITGKFFCLLVKEGNGTDYKFRTYYYHRDIFKKILMQ